MLTAKMGVVVMRVVTAGLLVSSGLAYCDVLYVPQYDAQLEDGELDQQERLIAQQQDTGREELQSKESSAAEAIFQACLSSASATHAASWAAECKRLAERNQQDRSDCLAKLNLPKTYCDISYPARDASANCRLPEEVATVVDADLERARYRCVRERAGAE